MDHRPTESLQPRISRRARLRGHARRLLPFALTAFIPLLLVTAFYILAIRPHELTGGYVRDAVAQAMASATPAPAYSALVYQVIQPSLVLIEVTEPSKEGGSAHALGSGVVIDQAGQILTSLHVVADARSIRITFADGTQTGAQVTATQPESDIAVLQPGKLPSVLAPAVLGSSGSMRVGDEAYVVGNPFGLYSSMSAGVISGFNRTFRPPEGKQELKGLIQVDAAINPGNSGGPLLNRYGYVIGIVTGIVNPTEENFFVGIGFAVPINVAVGGMGSPPY